MKGEKKPDSATGKILGIDKLSVKRIHLKRKYIIVVLLAALVMSVVVWKKVKKSDSIQFKTQKVQRGDITVIVTATGTIKPINEVEVGSELSGIVESVEVDYNDKVKVGQPLAKLDTSKLNAQVTQSRAAFEAAEANVLQAKATLNETGSKLEQYKKVRELSDGKVPSQTEFDAAQAAYDRARADVASATAAVSQAKAALEAYQTDLSKAVIRSPINGIVLTRDVEPGQTVAAAFQAPVLFTLAEDLTKMELHVDVDEADIGQVKEGQQATFTVDAYPNRDFEAKIIQTRYGSQTVEGVVTYETVLKVDNTDLSLRPGMTATADVIVMKIENTILVPNSALRFTMPADENEGDSGGFVNKLFPHPPREETKQKNSDVSNSNQQLWVLKDGKPVAIQVTTGATDGVMTEVLNGGIEQGMLVLTDVISEGR